MNETMKAAIAALKSSQHMHAGQSKETAALIAEMQGWDLDHLNKRADDAERVLAHAVETRDAYIDASITIYGKLYDADGLMGVDVEADRLARDVCAYADAAAKKLERTDILLRVAEAVVHGWDRTADGADSVRHPDGAVINVRRVVAEMKAGTEPDTAVIECPVKCEVCGVAITDATASFEMAHLCGECAGEYMERLRREHDPGGEAPGPFTAGADTFASLAHKRRAIAKWAGDGIEPFWFVRSGDGSMALVGGEASAKMIEHRLNGYQDAVDRADAAEAMVCELRKAGDNLVERWDDFGADIGSEVEGLRKALATTQPVADRWVSRAEAAHMVEEATCLAKAEEESAFSSLYAAGDRIAELERDLAACMEAKSALAREADALHDAQCYEYRKLEERRDKVAKERDAAIRERDEALSKIKEIRYVEQTASAIKAFCRGASSYIGNSDVETAVKHLANDRDEVGIQLHAAREEIERLKSIRSLLQRAHDAWTGKGPAIDLDAMEQELIGAVAASVPGDESAKKGGE